MDISGPHPGVATVRTAVARAVEVDHILIWVRPGAPEVAALHASGLRVGERRTHHTGNGTSSVSVFFENAYLELLYLDHHVSDAAVSDAERAANQRRAHWRDTGAVPFGIGLRRLVDAPDSLPFPTRRSAQPWMRPGTAIRVLEGSDGPFTPGVFVVPQYMALTGWIDRARRDTAFAALLVHPLGVHRVTAVQLTIKGEVAPAAPVRMLNDAGVVRLASGPEPLLDFTFDGGARGRNHDFRPELQLAIHY